MVTCYDPDYKATRLLKQGKAALEKPFAELAAWLASRWQVVVLNVIYSEPASLHGRGRLLVVFEHSRELRQFYDRFNFDRLKQQAIGWQFAEIVNRQTPTRYKTERLFVAFSAFAPLAREAADSHITDAEVRALQERIANPDLWTIHRCFGRVTFMFYTDEQAKVHAGRGFHEAYADLYFELLKPHDEFDYLRRSRFTAAFDSKETFDTRYEGSWFYYDR